MGRGGDPGGGEAQTQPTPGHNESIRVALHVVRARALCHGVWHTVSRIKLTGAVPRTLGAKLN